MRTLLPLATGVLAVIYMVVLWVPRTLRRNLPISDQNLQKIVFFIPFSENNLIKTNFTPAEKSPQQNHSPESSVDDRGLDLLLDMCSPHCLFSACFIFFSPQLQNYDLSSGLSNLEEFLVFFSTFQFWGGLNENAAHRLMYLYAHSPVGEQFEKGWAYGLVGDMSLWLDMEISKVTHKAQSFCLGLQIRM